MALSLRVLCWNIAEVRVGDGGLRQIALHIRSKSPDIVLLNEVRKPSWFWENICRRPDQTAVLARELGLPYHAFGGTNRTGLTGQKGVAVLSRYPLGPQRVHPVMVGSRKTGFGTLVTSVTIDGCLHHILSTRFAPHNDDGTNRLENPLGIQQALELVRSLGPGSTLIFGGDFNASTKPATNEYEDAMVQFLASSGLKEAVTEGSQATGHPPEDRVDYLFYRGEYKVSEAEFHEPQPRVSDHPWVFAVLESTRPPP
jgi:endonuclease/exonuclease/phosphatase family metal-dependent hydrolase